MRSITKTKRKFNRYCTQCGAVYLRVNVVDVWTIRAPGKRLGWIKEKTKLCNACCTLKQAAKMMLAADLPEVAAAIEKARKE